MKTHAEYQATQPESRGLSIENIYEDSSRVGVKVIMEIQVGSHVTLPESRGLGIVCKYV